MRLYQVLLAISRKNTTIEIGYIDEQGQDASNVLPLTGSSPIYIGPKSSINGMFSGINAEFIDRINSCRLAILSIPSFYDITWKNDRFFGPTIASPAFHKY